MRFVRETLLDPRSPACWWRHPLMASRVVSGAVENALLPFADRLLGRRGHECPVCGWRGRRFRNFLSGDEVILHCICPGCGAFDRQRLLVLGVREQAALARTGPGVIVGFSLSPALRFLLEHEGLARCFRCDIDAADRRFSPDFAADLRRTRCATLRSTGSSAAMCWSISRARTVHRRDQAHPGARRYGVAAGAPGAGPGAQPAHSRGSLPRARPRLAVRSRFRSPDRASRLAGHRGRGPRRSRGEGTVLYGIDPDERYWLVRKS